MPLEPFTDSSSESTSSDDGETKISKATHLQHLLPKSSLPAQKNDDLTLDQKSKSSDSNSEIKALTEGHVTHLSTDSDKSSPRLQSISESNQTSKINKSPASYSSLPINGECRLILCLEKPSDANYSRLPLAETNYLRYKNELFYLSKETGLISLIQADEENLKSFDTETRDTPSLTQVLNRSEEEKLKRFDAAFKIPLNWNRLKHHTLSSHEGLKKLKKLLPAEKPSDWQAKNGCDLLISETSPSSKGWELPRKRLPNLTANAYARFEDQLWYVKTEKDGSLTKVIIPLSKEQLAKFDRRMDTLACEHRHLTDKELDKIHKLTNHIHRTRAQKIWAFIGKICSGFFAISCGISTAAAFVAWNIMTGGAAGIVAALIFTAGFLVNWWIFKQYVPSVLIDLFAREKFAIDEEGRPLGWRKKIWLAIALVFSFSVGVTFAGLSFNSTLALGTAFPLLAAIAPALIYIAPFLLAVTFICMTALMLKDIADLIKKVNVKKTIIDFVKMLFSKNPHHHENRSNAYLQVTRVFRLVLTTIFVFFAVFGLFSTMNACAPGVQTILLGIPHLSDKIVSGLTNAIALGLAFVGQLPFGLTKVFEFIQNLGLLPSTHKKPLKPEAVEKTEKKEGMSTIQKGQVGLQLSQAIINAVSNGILALIGAGKLLFNQVVALIGGTGNSAGAAVAAIMIKDDEETSDEEEPITWVDMDKIEPNNDKIIDIKPDNKSLIDLSSSSSGKISPPDLTDKIMTSNSGLFKPQPLIPPVAKNADEPSRHCVIL